MKHGIVLEYPVNRLCTNPKETRSVGKMGESEEERCYMIIEVGYTESRVCYSIKSFYLRITVNFTWIWEKKRE